MRFSACAELSYKQGNTVHFFCVASTSGLERYARGDRSALRLAQRYPPELHESAHAECGERIQANDPGDKMPALQVLTAVLEEERTNKYFLSISLRSRVREAARFTGALPTTHGYALISSGGLSK